LLQYFSEDQNTNIMRKLGDNIMNKLLKFVPALLVAAAMLAPHSSVAQRVVGGITGGGTANMDDGEGTSIFGMGIQLLQGGTAQGQFDCVDQMGDSFPGNFVGRVTSWSQNPDGTISFSGIGTDIEFPGGPALTNLPYTVTIQQFGGPGVGHWTLDIPAFGGIVCFETLVTGQIVQR
jgi:hypothetical protein